MLRRKKLNMKTELAIAVALLWAASSVLSQSALTQPTPALQIIAKPNPFARGQLVVAVKDLPSSKVLTGPIVDSDGKSREDMVSLWNLEIGEVFKFGRYCPREEWLKNADQCNAPEAKLVEDESYAFMTMGPMWLMVPASVVAAVPEKDVATAAMKHAAQLKEHIAICTQDAKQTDSPEDDKDGGLIAMRGDWAERSGVWRGPDGSIVSSKEPPNTKGPFRVHRRAVDHLIEAMICRRDIAVANGDRSPAEADAQFDQWLANKRQQEALTNIQNQLNGIRNR